MPNLSDPNIFPAKMMTRQFQALKDYVSGRNIEADLRQSMNTCNFRKSSMYNRNEIEKWLTNGWNTEHILRMSEHLFDDPINSYAIQWTFPQAYYSCLCITLGFFQTIGFQEKKHTAVIKRIGLLIKDGKYPDYISFFANGGIHQIIFSGVARIPGGSTVVYDPSDEASMRNQIAQFLNATREIDLTRKKEHFNFKTKRGTNKKRFSRKDWERVSEKLGTTNILSLLYRKRIKFNYDNIDPVFSEELNANAIYQNLLFLVSKINLIHEAFIFNVLGQTEYNTIINLRNDRPEFIQARFEIILQTLGEQSN